MANNMLQNEVHYMFNPNSGNCMINGSVMIINDGANKEEKKQDTPKFGSKRI